MKKRFGTFLLLLVSQAHCFAQDLPATTAAPQTMVRLPDAEGIVVAKSVGNLFHGMQNDPTPWECEPTLLYAAKYQLQQREMDFVLDFCSVLALAKRGALGSNIMNERFRQGRHGEPQDGKEIAALPRCQAVLCGGVWPETALSGQVKAVSIVVASTEALAPG